MSLIRLRINTVKWWLCGKPRMAKPAGRHTGGNRNVGNDLLDGVLPGGLPRAHRGAVMTEHLKCPRCGSENLALMRTLDKKYCACGQWMTWKLKPGQKPVGYGVDPERVTSCTGEIDDHVRADVLGEG